MCHIYALHSWSLNFCLPSRSVFFHPSFPFSFKPHPPHLGYTAHLLPIASCPSLSITCVWLSFGFTCKAMYHSALDWYQVANHACFWLTDFVSPLVSPPADFKLCRYQFVFLSAYPHSCLGFCLTALEFDLYLSTCGLRYFTGSNLGITSTTLFPVKLLD